MIPDGFYGVRGEQTSDLDYQLGGYLDLPVARNNFDKNKIQYYQPEVAAMSCTLHGALGAISDLTGYKFTLDERKALWAQALKLDASNVEGWWINKAVDLARQYWNSKNAEQFISLSVQLGSPQFNAMIEKGYSVVIGYSGNGNYNLDDADGILNATNFGTSSYAHCVRMTYKDKDTYNLVVDNYFGNGHNTYSVPKANLQALLDNKVFFKTGYVFVYLTDYNKFQSSQNVSPWAQVSVPKAVAKDIDVSEPKRQVTVANIEMALFKLGVVSSMAGNITEERLAVILDRLHLL